ncbi:MAG: DUF975 family protein [Bacteroidales bacterium]|nr:DUF975 family protein [Bacteroidales bacterium]
MKTNTEFKNEALAALKGNWGPAVLAVLVFAGVVLALFVPFFIKSMTLSSDLTDLEATKGVMGWFWFYFLGLLLIGGPLYVGMVNSFKKLLTSGDNRLVDNEFKIGFGNWLHHTWGYLLRSVFIILWTLLFFIPGIIKSLSYAMTNYILVDYPELSANRAIDLSREMMRGHKYDLFYLYLGFAGWYLLSILTLGIGYFWFIPYVQTAQSSFYYEVKADWEARRSLSQTA